MLYDLKCALCNKNFQSDQPKAKGCSLECKLKRERIRKNNWLTNKYQTNPEYKQIILARGRASYKKFIQERSIRVANWRTSHKEWIKEYWRNPLKARARLRKKKEMVFNYYGNKCECCGETIKEFLTIDHIMGGGGKHRKQKGVKNSIYLWLIRNNFPKGFRTLCMNCNFARGHHHYCPHQISPLNKKLYINLPPKLKSSSIKVEYLDHIDVDLPE